MAEETATAEKTEAEALLDIGADPAEVDSSLDALMEEHGESPSEGDADKDVRSPSSRERDDTGKFKKKGETEAEPETDDDFETARAALERDGYSEDMIAILAKDADAFKAAGLKRAESQKETDGKFKEHEQTARELAEVRRVLAKQAKDDGAALPASATDKQFNDLLNPLITYLGGENDEDLAKAVRGPFEAVMKDITALKGELDESVNVTVRQQVAEEFPQITDDARFKDVKDLMDDLKYKYPTLDRTALMTKAARIEFGEEIAEAKAAAKKRTNRQRDAAASDTTKGRTTAKGDASETETHEELQNAALDARMEGRDADADEIERKIQKRFFS